MKEKIIAFIEQRLEYTDKLDTIREKLSVMNQCFGVVAFAYDLLIAEEKREQAIQIEKLWNEIYEPRFEEKNLWLKATFCANCQ